MENGKRRSMNRRLPCTHLGQRCGHWTIISRASFTAARNLILASGLRCKYQSAAASSSSQAPGSKRYNLFSGIRQTRCEAAAHLFVRYHLGFAGLNVVDAALDFLRPSPLHTLIDEPFIHFAV